MGRGGEMGQPESQPARESPTAVCTPSATGHGCDALRFPEARRSRGSDGRHRLRNYHCDSPLVAQGAARGTLTRAAVRLLHGKSQRPTGRLSVH
jgi:hypothetical protein